MDLYFFTANPDQIRSTSSAQISGYVVDWEKCDKAKRQTGANTSISNYSVADLERARNLTTKHLICRINNHPALIATEIEQSIAAGADEILLPMVKTAEEVRAALDLVAGRAPLGILIETNEAVAIASKLNDLPLSRIYIGLNDLSISRNQAHNILLPLVDGTIDALRGKITRPFGIAGVTIPGKGSPIPVELLLAELLRLEVAFTFLRRSFIKDSSPDSYATDIENIHRLIAAAAELKNGLRLHRREQFIQMVQACSTN
ncbi:aldolase [bacterium]|nr:aldolase [bacterium]